VVGVERAEPGERGEVEQCPRSSSSYASDVDSSCSPDTPRQLPPSLPS